MKDMTRRAGTGISLKMALMTTLATLSPLAAYAQVKPTVTVINPVSNPVNTRITNSVVPVEVSNADPIPVAVSDSEGSREIYFKKVKVRLPNEDSVCNSDDPITVPAGKRLVIEYVSAYGSVVVPAELVVFMLRHPSAPEEDFLYVPAGKSANAGDGNISAGGQFVHAYSDESLWACYYPSETTAGVVNVSVVGYLLDKP